MVEYFIKESTLTDIADAIREKKGTSYLYDPAEYASEIRSIEGRSPMPIEISTEAEMTALLETAEVGSVYKYVGESTDIYVKNALYMVEVPAVGGGDDSN